MHLVHFLELISEVVPRQPRKRLESEDNCNNLSVRFIRFRRYSGEASVPCPGQFICMTFLCFM